MPKIKYWISCFLIFSFFCLGIINQTLAQCASCKAAAATTDDTGQLVVGAGLNTGILYLLALPFLCIGFVVFRWYIKGKQLEKEGLR